MKKPGFLGSFTKNMDRYFQKLRPSTSLSTREARFIQTERKRFPTVILRDTVVIPQMLASLTVQRKSFVKAIEIALATPGKGLFLISQRDSRIDNPTRRNIFEIGVLARVIHSLKLQNGSIKIMVEGVKRGRLLRLSKRNRAVFAEVEVYSITYPADARMLVYMAKVQPLEQLTSILKFNDPDRFADTIAAHLARVDTEGKQTLLELLNPYERLEYLQNFIDIEVEESNSRKPELSGTKKGEEFGQKVYRVLENLAVRHPGRFRVQRQPKIELQNKEIIFPDFDIQIDLPHQRSFYYVECQDRKRSSKTILHKIQHVRSKHWRKTFMFVYPTMISAELKRSLESEGVIHFPFDEFIVYMENIGSMLDALVGVTPKSDFKSGLKYGQCERGDGIKSDAPAHLKFPPRRY